MPAIGSSERTMRDGASQLRYIGSAYAHFVTDYPSPAFRGDGQAVRQEAERKSCHLSKLASSRIAHISGKVNKL